jgi:cytochrome c-type biogenesis protein CcmH/NrfG
MLIGQMVVVSLFLPLGPVFVFVAEGEARPFVALFALIWVAACITILLSSAKTLKLVKTGKIEIAEVGDGDQPRDSAFAQRLRDLEALKKEGLVSNAEYQKKRQQILQDKW